jgi:hypothetical protein
MKFDRMRKRIGWLLALGALVWAEGAGRAGAAVTLASSCEKVALTGEVNAGHEWRAEIGEGWVFRVLPIAPGKAGYSGWDLVVDRTELTGYPDALLLATPPYESISQREIGTTYGLRAQDAIGWNPRSFRFLHSVISFRERQKRYLAASQEDMRSYRVFTTHSELAMNRLSSAGEFRILDARLTPGIADPAPFAASWAAQAARTPHSEEAPARGAPTPLGELHWMRFSVTLWLPEGWQMPPGVHAVRGACQ